MLSGCLCLCQGRSPSEKEKAVPKKKEAPKKKKKKEVVASKFFYVCYSEDGWPVCAH